MACPGSTKNKTLCTAPSFHTTWCCSYLLEILAGHKVTVPGQILSPCYLGGLAVYWMYCLDWAQVDPQLNAVAAAVAAAELEVGTVCGLAAG